MSDKIKSSGNKIIIPYSNGLHDTFKVDRYGNLYDGHTTANLKNGAKLRINTDSLRTRSESSFNDK
jgi:hypothetical protein